MYMVDNTYIAMHPFIINQGHVHTYVEKAGSKIKILLHSTLPWVSYIVMHVFRVGQIGETETWPKTVIKCSL